MDSDSQCEQGGHSLVIWGDPLRATLTELKYDHRINAQISGSTEDFSSWLASGLLDAPRTHVRQSPTAPVGPQLPGVH